jgi:hypothetical protein
MEPPPYSPAERRKPPRKGCRSEKRKRTAPVPVRYLPEERAEVLADAEAAGMSLGGYIRSRTLKQPKTRARREPSVAVIVLLSLKAELNRVGGHIYQLVRHMNFGGYPEAGEAHAALANYFAVSAVIQSALEREKTRP